MSYPSYIIIFLNIGLIKIHLVTDLHSQQQFLRPLLPVGSFDKISIVYEESITIFFPYTYIIETCSSVYSPGIDMFTPGYPSYYPPNLDCRYLIRANIGKIVKVNYLYQYNDPNPPLEANADWIEVSIKLNIFFSSQ